MLCAFSRVHCGVHRRKSNVTVCGFCGNIITEWNSFITRRADALNQARFNMSFFVSYFMLYVNDIKDMFYRHFALLLKIRIQVKE